MRLEIRATQLELSPELRERIEKRLRFALSRFAARIQRVTVRLGDLNGPRGGVDAVFRVSVHLQGREPLVIEDRDARLETAVDRGADRIGRLVGRELERLRNAHGLQMG